ERARQQLAAAGREALRRRGRPGRDHHPAPARYEVASGEERRAGQGPLAVRPGGRRGALRGPRHARAGGARAPRGGLGPLPEPRPRSPSEAGSRVLRRTGPGGMLARTPSVPRRARTFARVARNGLRTAVAMFVDRVKIFVKGGDGGNG